MKLKTIFALTFIPFLLASCSNAPTPSGEEVKVTGVELNQSSITIKENDTYQLRATVSPSDATNKYVSYASNNSTIADVSNSGLITAYNEGSCIVTVTTVDGGYTADCHVSVYKEGSQSIPVTGIEFDIEELNLVVGEQGQATASVKPSNATNKNITYESDDESVATVTSAGVVTAIGEGFASIIATSVDGGYTAECYVNVLRVAPTVISVTGVSISPESLEMNIGDEDRVSANVVPVHATNSRVSYASSNTNVVTVTAAGKVTALAAGTATITVTTEDGGFTDTCSIKVNEVPVIKEARMQDTPILHCWNWTANNIKNELENIKDAGYKSIQLSPFQPQKGYYEGQTWQSQWWKLYQPLGFSVATSEDHHKNVLGTKSELTALCAKAKYLGIDVIMDIVANHVASEGATVITDEVKYVEPEIYNQHLIHDMTKWANDNDPESVVKGSLGGLNDLKTETTTVQNRVASLLKEYIDCGVSGFRFDAAKHIETPDDNFGEGKDYSSDFWPNVLNTTTAYAVSKGLEAPFYYGEILSNCGSGRSFSSYTKYMSTVDSRQGSTVLAAVNEQEILKVTDEYNTGIKPSQLVLWAESHDTFANDDGESKGIGQDIVNKAYIMQASRKDAATLYFARPTNSTKFGDIGTTVYKSDEIKAINNFHNLFVNQSESISTEKGCFVNVRGKLGAVIVGISNSSNTLNITIPNLEDGNYVDMITNTNYVVSNNSTTVTLTNGACILKNKDKTISNTPEIEVGNYSKIFSENQDIPVTIKNATSKTYSINGGTENNIVSNWISVPSTTANGNVTVKITASNEHGMVSKTLNLFKTTSLIGKSLIISDVDTSNAILCWAWKGGTDGAWYDPTEEGNAIGFSLGDKDMFILVQFAPGTTKYTADWADALKQTDDTPLSKVLYSFKEFTFKQSS